MLGPEIYASDLGNNLIKVRDDKGYAEIALTEPWACVVAAYALTYRTQIKNGGTLWVIGAGGSKSYDISTGSKSEFPPGAIWLTKVPEPLMAGSGNALPPWAWKSLRCRIYPPRRRGLRTTLRFWAQMRI